MPQAARARSTRKCLRRGGQYQPIPDTLREPEPPPFLGAAANHATRRVPTAAEIETAGEVRERLTVGSYDSVASVVVLDDDRLAGIVPIERLLASARETSIADLMDRDPPAVAPDTSQERAAHTMIEHGESSLPVVDAEGRFAGLIPAHPMLGVLIDEHEEDLARLGGYAAGSQAARSAAEEPVSRRLVHRLPWLAVGLVGAMASALLVGAFEEELDANVLLAFFVPGLVYMAGAVGTQTEIVLIRAMAAGTSVRSVFRGELVTGLIIGIAIGGAFFAFALIGWGDFDVALTIGLALAASCSLATLVAIALPSLIQRMGRDPAFGSGPLATVVQDLLSIAVYFAIVVAIVA